VNERLQAVSKHTPEVIKALAASSKMNLSPIRSHSGKEANFLSVSFNCMFVDKRNACNTLLLLAEIY